MHSSTGADYTFRHSEYVLLEIHLAIDYRPALCQTAPMSRLSRKFVAVLMLLWLPLFSGNALAVSVSMQLQRGDCHEAATVQTMAHADLGEHHQHHGEMPAVADEQTPSCSACGVCHLACTGYLTVPDADAVTLQTAAREATPYLVIYQSFTSAPLLPPPLVRV